MKQDMPSSETIDELKKKVLELSDVVKMEDKMTERGGIQ